MAVRRRLRFLAWFFRISRWGNVLLLSATLYLAAVFLLNPTDAKLERLLNWRLLLAVVATACITAGGYIINDYFDVQIDSINRPAAQLVGRRVPRRRALLLHGLLRALGVLLGLLASYKVGVLELIAANLLYLYSAKLKRSAGWGNALVAFLTAAGLLVPWLLFGHARPVLWAYFVFCFLISFLREIVKDAEDMRGDAAYGCRTLPIVFGLPTTRLWVQGLLFGLLLAALGLPLLSGSWAAAYNTVLLVPAYYFLQDLQMADTRQDFRRLSRLAKIMMALGVLGMVVA
jgi:4-hydroxybenzoate polyprenyltransferase